MRESGVAFPGDTFVADSVTAAAGAIAPTKVAGYFAQCFTQSSPSGLNSFSPPAFHKLPGWPGPVVK